MTFLEPLRTMGVLQQAPTPFMIGTRVSRYQIVEKRGSGGMGVVTVSMPYDQRAIEAKIRRCLFTRVCSVGPNVIS